jgi:hypothetical protein
MSNDRLARKIWKYLRKYDGYQPFGYDWRTLAITHPQLCKILRQIS